MYFELHFSRRASTISRQYQSSIKLIVNIKNLPSFFCLPHSYSVEALILVILLFLRSQYTIDGVKLNKYSMAWLFDSLVRSFENSKSHARYTKPRSKNKLALQLIQAPILRLCIITSLIQLYENDLEAVFSGKLSIERSTL